MQDTVIEEGADLEYVITDKNVTVTADKELKGSDTFPVYIAKSRTRGYPLAWMQSDNDAVDGLIWIAWVV